jgi:hypothetical protein
LLLALALAAVALEAQDALQAQAAGSSAAMPPARFVDVTVKAGINFLHQAPHTSRKYLIETMGSGVALFDCDNDGLLDIFLVNGAPYADPTPKGFIPRKTGPEYWNRLYHQKPNGTFDDITEKAGLQGVGYGMGVAVGDYDNDGKRRRSIHGANSDAPSMVSANSTNRRTGWNGSYFRDMEGLYGSWSLRGDVRFSGRDYGSRAGCSSRS